MLDITANFVLLNARPEFGHELAGRILVTSPAWLTVCAALEATDPRRPGWSRCGRARDTFARGELAWAALDAWLCEFAEQDAFFGCGSAH
jgi:hypothetical protein